MKFSFMLHLFELDFLEIHLKQKNSEIHYFGFELCCELFFRWTRVYSGALVLRIKNNPCCAIMQQNKGSTLIAIAPHHPGYTHTPCLD